MKGKKVSYREDLERKAALAENKAAQAEQSGRSRWASRYREQAEKYREELDLMATPERQRLHFIELAAKATECDQLAERARGERPDLVRHYMRCADDYRQRASGVDWHAAWDEYHKTQRRVSIGLIQEALDALAAIGISPKEFPRFLSCLVEETLLALQDSGARRPAGFSGCGNFYSIAAVSGTPKGEDPHRCKRSKQHMASVVAAEFAMQAAMYASDQPASTESD